MHRDVDGRDLHADDAVDFSLVQVGQRDIVAVQKGKAGVIILKIQRFTQSGRQLVDKTENALIGAAVFFVH